jgi:hypothetical protein
VKVVPHVVLITVKVPGEAHVVPNARRLIGLHAGTAKLLAQHAGGIKRLIADDLGR